MERRKHKYFREISKTRIRKHNYKRDMYEHLQGAVDSIY